ncbi:hypothetical protein DACRYDRAFT_57370 [Dacryopinax primogenitus]|uniref:Core domain-containing protein n=1 Tax=Dacryopinax primogenitus (strain DJM 731) TaxID=1858805 RepID=M5FXX1_DACPD|nr:uncharacterized protein DACRYDRAFT_57370 [Dacryopinax primogenitus]EJT98391.1 hypothetical protein DACRYDRAFT_57370 [Dacryopinax primogenitus]
MSAIVSLAVRRSVLAGSCRVVSVRPGRRLINPTVLSAPSTTHRRSFASAPPLPTITSADQAILLYAPTPKQLEALELEVDPNVFNEARLIITERAAEQLRRVAEKANNSEIALRVGVESGGCHGYQYTMEVTSEYEPDDFVFTRADTQPSKVIIDAVSLGLLKGATVDYATELIGSSFRIMENPQAKGSGCGCGVSWEANV